MNLHDLQERIRDLGGWERWEGRLRGLHAELIHPKSRDFSMQGVGGTLFHGSNLEFLSRNIAPAFDDEAHYSASETRAIRTIADLNAALRARGIDLNVVLAPSKLEIYPDPYAKEIESDDPACMQLYRQMYRLLVSDVETVNLVPAFM
jgi:hypothetical protein